MLEGVLALEGVAARVPERCWNGFQGRNGPLEGGFQQGSSRGFQRKKGFQQGF